MVCVVSTLVLIGIVARYGQLDYHDAGTAMFGSIAIMLLCASAVAVAVEGEGGFVAALRRLFLRFFGRYSYAMYIVHTAVLAALNRYWPFGSLAPIGGFTLPAQTTWFVLYASLSTGAAFLSWHLVEKHFLRLKRFFPYRLQRG
jgi:peptidoglycan/LPS O-acetylase OafA/YrhL